MPTTIYAQDHQFAAASGTNIDVTPNYSYFDHPPNSTKELTITSNMGDSNPFLFEVGETYDLTWTGHGGGDMDDAVIIRSDYLGPGEGAIVFEGTNSITSEPFQMVWTPGFDLEQWYWDNGGGPSSPNAFWTSDQNTAETYEVQCYTRGTIILTKRGGVPVEQLKTDDFVVTIDRGLQPIRWICSGNHPLEDSAVGSKPVLIKAGALGQNLPVQDLMVSPQHRILVGKNGQLQNVFATEVFAPAKSLIGLPGIRHMQGKTQVTWFHFACDQHEVVIANGTLSESLLLGPMVMSDLPTSDCQVLTDLFGPAETPDAALNGPPARECLTAGAAKRQLARHRRETRRASSGKSKWGAGANQWRRTEQSSNAHGSA